MTIRFEDAVRIELYCCNAKGMNLVGNLSLRGPSDATRLGFECKTCGRRVTVMDAWDGPGESIYENDMEE